MRQALAGRRALVTGASRGIGREIALALAADGARVALHYGASREQAEAVLAALPGTGHALLQADLAVEEEAARLAGRAAAALGGLDILVNNAGIFRDHPVREVDAATWAARWKEILAVNLLAPALLIHAARPFLAEAGGGHIVNIGSRGAFRGEPTAPAYGASKAGLHGLGQYMAQALAPDGIYVMNLAPGFVETEMAREALQGERGVATRAQSPHGRVARAEEIAQTVCFVVSGRADWLTGGTIDLNGASYLR
ncbi:MAG: SDR family oxidoreductase [bacterium]|nr:SDR family oxidoreductase [bacterium]